MGFTHKVLKNRLCLRTLWVESIPKPIPRFLLPILAQNSDSGS